MENEQEGKCRESRRRQCWGNAGANESFTHFACIHHARASSCHRTPSLSVEDLQLRSQNLFGTSFTLHEQSQLSPDDRRQTHKSGHRRNSRDRMSGRMGPLVKSTPRINRPKILYIRASSKRNFSLGCQQDANRKFTSRPMAATSNGVRKAYLLMVPILTY